MSATITAPKTDVQGHAPGVAYDDGPNWATPCECGRRFTAKSPSASKARHTAHAEQEAKKAARQPKTGDQPDPESEQSPSTFSGRIKICGCGCGGQLARRAGGVFLSGHDARFKSILAKAHMAGLEVRHPKSGEMDKPLVIAAWLDDRRGNGSTFWQDKVSAGVKITEPKAPRVRVERTMTDEEIGQLKAQRLIDMLDNRHPVSGDEGTLTMRSGTVCRARVLRRQGDGSIQVRILTGQSAGTDVVVPDIRFAKDRRSTNQYT